MVVNGAHRAQAMRQKPIADIRACWIAGVSVTRTAVFAAGWPARKPATQTVWPMQA
jgi:hypothetical protein